MIFKIPTGLKKTIMITVALLGLLLVDNAPACAEASNERMPNEGSRRQNAVVDGQNQAGASIPETNSRTSEEIESESRPPEEPNSAGPKKKPIKDFQPTEKIEADQAVDFPYDI